MLKPTALSFLFFLCCSCASFGPQNTEEAELRLKMGTAYLEKGNYPLALSELLNAAELDPENPVIQNHLGLTYYARNRMDLSEKRFRQALALDPKYTDAENNLGRLLIELGKFSEAELFLRKASSDLTFPNPEKPLTNLGLCFFRQGRYNEAKTTLSSALEYQRQNCQAQTLFGRTLLELKDYSGSAMTLDRAIGFCGNDVADEAQYYSALAHFKTGDAHKAQNRLEEIIRIYPNGKYRDRARTLLDTMKRTSHE